MMDFGSVGFPLGGPFAPAGTTTFGGGFISGTANTYTGAATLTLVDSGVTPGTYSNPTISVDSKGRITLASSGATATFRLVGDVTGGSGDNTINVNLASTGVSSGTYDRVTVDSKGRVTAGFGMPSSGVVAGYYANPNIQVDAFGRVVSAANGVVASETLPNTGVTAGSYTLANFTVDAKGRITAASNGVAEVEPELPPSGLTGQVLVKNSPTSYDVKWATLSIDEEEPEIVDPITLVQMGGQAAQAFTTVKTPANTTVGNTLLALGTHFSNYSGNPAGGDFNFIAGTNGGSYDGVYAAWKNVTTAGTSYVPFTSPTSGAGTSALFEISGLDPVGPVDVSHAVPAGDLATTHTMSITTDADRTIVVGMISAVNSNISPDSVSGVTRGPSFVSGTRAIHLFHTFVENKGTTVSVTSTWPSEVRIVFQAVSLKQKTTGYYHSNWNTPQSPFGGVYLRSPDGTIYNLSVTNTGTVATTLVV